MVLEAQTLLWEECDGHGVGWLRLGWPRGGEAGQVCREGTVLLGFMVCSCLTGLLCEVLFVGVGVPLIEGNASLLMTSVIE